MEFLTNIELDKDKEVEHFDAEKDKKMLVQDAASDLVELQIHKSTNELLAKPGSIQLDAGDDDKMATGMKKTS